VTSFAPKALANLRLGHDVIASIRAIGEGKGKQDLFKERAPELLETLRQVAIIESTESSNRLEGVTAPRSAIERLVLREEHPRRGRASHWAWHEDAARPASHRSDGRRFFDLRVARALPERWLGHGSVRAAQRA
jgi:hypothetical protein